ncbi:MAG: carbon-nitrogen hydrolase family protein [Lachnospiraceae bacterium]|nr:carbon-nitrogen hydrolase family protein [Lachnospiraceae bacterium]
MRIAQFQTKVFGKKADNIAQVTEYMEDIAGKRVDMVVLGEMFNCPYDTKNFPVYAEKEGGDSWAACSELARRYCVYLVAGSMPEIDESGKIYNTSYVFDREGRQIGKHRKAHLFDIDVEGGQSFQESVTLSSGDACTVFDTEFGRVGLCICFDFRFPELARGMVDQGAKMIVVPAAFNMTTGPAHWEIMFRSRALDNQCYVAGTSVARDNSAGYIAWGHTLLVSPWGDVVEEMDEKEGYIINDIDLEYVEKVRRELPLLTARRRDIYNL